MAEEDRIPFDRERSLSALVLGFRFFALAAVAGAAALLPGERVDRPLVAGGIVAAAAVALLEHHTLAHLPRRARVWWVLPHAALWTLLLHATGGQGSPLAVGYLLELPFSGVLSSRPGVVSAALASLIFYLAYAGTVGRPFQPAAAGLLLGLVALCSGISWRLVEMLERQRLRIARARAALEARADELAEELKRLGDSLCHALVTIDESGRIAGLNRSGAAMLGIDPDAAIGRPWQEVLGPDPTSCGRLVEVLDSGAAQHDLTMVLSPSPPRSVTVQAEIWAGTSQAGRRVHLLLDPGAEQVADDPVRRLGESAACIAHQIKNSIQALQGMDRGLGQPAGIGARVVTPEQCLAALQSLGTLAEDVLAMSGASRRRREPIAIQEVLHSAVVLLGQPGVRVIAPRPLLYVEADRSPLVHALFNLLDNAVRSSPRGEPVVVRVERREEWVTVEIADAGPGIPPGFALARRPLPSRNGSGLGLLAARRFVEACGGRLSLTSGDERGTRCRIELRAMAPAAVGSGGAA